MNLHHEAQAIAREAMREVAEYGGDVVDYIHQTCDGHEVSIYYGKAIDFCATHDTDAGEAWLEDCGGICQPGDTFGAIACRIAFATLYCASLEAMAELEAEAEEAEA